MPLKGIVDEALATRRPDRASRSSSSGGAALPAPMTRRARSVLGRVPRRGRPGRTAATCRWRRTSPAYILATSGTTAKPKLAVHTHGGYQVYIHAWAAGCFGLRPDDVWWSTSDIGWVVGHSYIVYAPLLRGCTTIAYEGAIDHPDPRRLWRIIEEFGVTGIFTSPTAVRLLMRYGEEHARALRPVAAWSASFCAGEVLNAAGLGVAPARGASRTACRSSTTCGRPRRAGRSSATRTAWRCCRSSPARRASRCRASRRRWSTPDGEPCAPGEKGIMVITRPFPGLIARLWGEPERYGQRLLGADARRVLHRRRGAHRRRRLRLVRRAGRRDHQDRRATGSARSRSRRRSCAHPAVAEAGVTGRPDELRGEVIAAFVVLKQGHEPSAAAAARAARHGAPRARAGGGHRRAATSSTCCPRRAAARSCAACSRP